MCMDLLGMSDLKTDLESSPNLSASLERGSPETPTLVDLIEIIVNEKEIIPFPPLSSSDVEHGKQGEDVLEKGTPQSTLQCCSCYDDLHSNASDSDSSFAAYVCKSPNCVGALCVVCLLRQVSLIISNALYAVPTIRCPGTCTGRIPTAIWRGVLQSMPNPQANIISARPVSELIQHVTAAYITLSRNFETTFIDEMSDLLDAIKDVLLSCDLTLTDLYNHALEEKIIPSISNQPVDLSEDVKSKSNPEEELSGHSLNSFSEFASLVYPNAPEPIFRSSRIFMTNKLTDQLDEYVKGGIADLATQTSIDPTACKTIFCLFLAEIAVCLRFRNRVQIFVESYEGRERDSAASYLMKKYADNAEVLMSITCATCHRTSGLFYSSKNNHLLVKEPSARQTLLENLTETLPEGASIKLLKSYIDFNEGAISSSSFLQTIRESDKTLSEHESRRFVEKILSLLTDLERRCVLQLEFLRQFPKISTPCCAREHCFTCKVDGHHENRTCEEVQRASYGVQCQFCPGCGVATVKTDGCSQLTCPCGRIWEWTEATVTGGFGSGTTGTGGFGAGSFGASATGAGGFGAGSFGASATGSGGFGSGTTGTGGFGAGSFGVSATGTGGFGAGSFGTSATGAGGFGAGSFGASATGTGSFGAGSFGTSATGSGGFGSGTTGSGGLTYPTRNHDNRTTGLFVGSSNGTPTTPAYWATSPAYSPTSPTYSPDLPVNYPTTVPSNHSSIATGGFESLPSPSDTRVPSNLYINQSLYGGHPILNCNPPISSVGFVPGIYVYSTPAGVYYIPGYLPLY
jgi:hypothetical protein